MPDYTQKPEERWLPTELRGHAIHIRDAANATQAELAAMTEAQLRHLVSDLAKAVVALDPRTQDD